MDTTPLALYERLTPSTIGRRFSLTAPTVTWTPDNAGRPMEVSVDAGLETVYAEDLEWFPSGLLESRTLTEGEESRQINWQYDTARRLRTETSEYPAALLETVLGTSQTFQHDEAENLTGHTYASACGDVDRSFSIGTGNQLSGASFDWDLNGNLTSKGDLSLSYDHGDRLTKVEDDGVTVAEYQYDALGRRVLRTVDGVHYATVWDGWRPIEEYRFSLDQWFLTHRQFHGDGLDEVVHLEIMDGGVPTAYWPVYDTSGNLAVLLDGNHEPVEKYFYTPFGERWVWSRGEAPRVEQVRLTGDAVLIELSEQVHASEVVKPGAVHLTGLSPAANQTVSLVDVDGRMAGRRIRIEISGEPEDLPVPGTTELSLLVSGTALSDLFDGTFAQDDLDLDFTWDPGVVVYDAAVPELEEACLTDHGKVRLVFSEPLTSAAQSLLTVDGQTQSWTTSSDGYTVTSSTAYTAGSHTLGFLSGAYDPVGNELADRTSLSFTATERPALLKLTTTGSLTQTSTVGNPFGFHGLHHDDETGFVYARHRYLDPELGRFLTTDPLGYVDGPNLYQFALNNPVNYSDPLGRLGFLTS